MKRLRSLSYALVASAGIAWTLPVYATGDCNNGKAIYFKKVGGIYISCAQSSCHGANVNNNNIVNGANNPLLIDSQLDNEPQMNNLRGTLNLTFSDIDDIATFLFYYPSACPSSGGTPNLQASPAPVTFAATAVGATSATTTITITNVGTASALAVTASSNDSTHFPLSANGCSGITLGTTAPGNTCSFKVAFHPTTAGALSNNITVNRTGGMLTVGSQRHRQRGRHARPVVYPFSTEFREPGGRHDQRVQQRDDLEHRRRRGERLQRVQHESQRIHGGEQFLHHDKRRGELCRRRDFHARRHRCAQRIDIGGQQRHRQPAGDQR